MLAILLWIVVVLAVVGTFAYFFTEHIDFLIAAWDWANSAVEDVSALLPAWVLPFAVVALVLSVLGIIIKLL